MDKPSAHIGAFYQLRDKRDLDQVLVNQMPREPRLGDVFFCVRPVSGAHEYCLVDLLEDGRVRLLLGQAIGADPLGAQLQCTASQADGQKLLDGLEIDCDIHAQVASYNLSLDAHARQERLLSVEPGCVLAGTAADGSPLFEGGYAMVLTNPGGMDPRLTLAVKSEDRLKRISMRVSQLSGALVADDQGMELFVKARKEPFVLQFLAPGTILRMPSSYLRLSGPNLLRPRQTARSGCYALLRKVTGGQREPTLHLSMRERGGGLHEVQVPTWGMSDRDIAVLN